MKSTARAIASLLCGAILVASCAAEEASTKSQGKIVNGTQAENGEFPFMVSLRRSSSGRHSCGGSLLNPGWVLTAAHCVHRRLPQMFNVQFGSPQLDPNTTKVVNVSKIFAHKGYAPRNRYENDIALLKLATPLQFGDDLMTVRLPQAQQQTPGNVSTTLIGWGLNATGGSVQPHLQKVQLQTFTDEECSQRYELQMHSTVICAGVPEGGKGQCSGDSGGPLLLPDNSTQIGIVSWSRKPCTVAPYPGVYTEVSAYIDWIMQTIDDEWQQQQQQQEGSPTTGEKDDLMKVISGDLIITHKSQPFPEERLAKKN